MNPTVPKPVVEEVMQRDQIEGSRMSTGSSEPFSVSGDGDRKSGWGSEQKSANQ
jgi:hypothetical protein